MKQHYNIRPSFIPRKLQVSSFSTNQNIFDTNGPVLLNSAGHLGVHFPQKETGESGCNTTPASLLSRQADSAQSLKYLLLILCLLPFSPELLYLPLNHLL